MCENTVFSVYFDHVSGAGGDDVPHYLSIIPKQATADGITGVCILPVRAGRLGLIRLFRHPLARWGWEVPKGFIDAEESPQQAAIRELVEETGFSVAIESVRLLGTITPESGVIKGRTRLFSAVLGDPVAEQAAISRELGHSKLQFFDRAEIANLIAAGEIEDACTLSTLYMYFAQPGSEDA